MIPKNIFQTFELKYENLPELGIQTTSTWKDMNPEWNYVYMGAEERRQYVKDLMPEMIIIFDLMPNMWQSDIWRYIIMFNLGGVYSDVDSVCTTPLNDMLKEYNNQDMVCLRSRFVNTLVGEFVNNSNFVSIKQSIILKITIDKMHQLADSWKKNYRPDNKELGLMLYNTIDTHIFSQNVLKHKDIVLFNLDDYSYHHDMYKFWKRNDEDMQGLWHLINLDKFKNRRNLSNID